MDWKFDDRRYTKEKYRSGGKNGYGGITIGNLITWSLIQNCITREDTKYITDNG